MSDGGNITHDILIEGASDIPTPPTVELPVYRYDPAHWDGWGFEDWSTWTQGQAANNGASVSNYTGRNADLCQISGADWSLDGEWDSPVGATVMDARACSILDFNGSSGTVNVNLYGDLTLIVENFQHVGTLNVRSGDGGNYDFRIIAPFTSSSDQCGRRTGGTVGFSAGGVFVDPAVGLFLYSPERVALTNGMNFSGQVYGCEMSFSNDITISYANIGLPTWQ